MRSRLLERWRKSLGLRLAGWYFVIFVASFVALAVISYTFLASSLSDNRKAIETRLSELGAAAESGGVERVEETARTPARASRRRTFFVRVVSASGDEIFLNAPQLWERFKLESLDAGATEGAWQYVPAKSGGDVLEVTAAKLPNGYVLQVGRTVEARDEILEDYRNTIAAVAAPMVLLALGGGALFAFRAVRPIRNLIETTRSIVETARVDLRVPQGRGGSELDELVTLFNKMLERIEGLIQGIREALDNVAHDLRTPIARLRGVAEMNLNAPSGADGCRDALAGCIEEADRIIELLNSLMDISEAETGALRLAYETVSVGAVLAEVVDLYQYVAEEKNLSLALDCPQDLAVRADGRRLRRALANLLDNAIKYNAPGGHVCVSGRRDRNRVVFEVKDDGPGIPADELPKIWDRLYRGDKSRSEPGLGLGLSLVRAIARAHDGDVAVQSSPGAGAVFTMALPAPSPDTTLRPANLSEK